MGEKLCLCLVEGMSGKGEHLILSVLCEEVVHIVEDVFCSVSLSQSSVQTAVLGVVGNEHWVSSLKPQTFKGAQDEKR